MNPSLAHKRLAKMNPRKVQHTPLFFWFMNLTCGRNTYTITYGHKPDFVGSTPEKTLITNFESGYFKDLLEQKRDSRFSLTLLDLQVL